MMLVVADTTPLRYLVEIGYESLLPRMFDQIWIPGTVARELQGKGTPEVIQQWAKQLPSWVTVRENVNVAFEFEVSGLDRGEWEAIQLAQEIHANLLLIDERAGARIAREHGLTVTGTLGILVEAARSGFVSIDEALARLTRTNFRRTHGLFEEVRQRVRISRHDE